MAGPEYVARPCCVVVWCGVSFLVTRYTATFEAPTLDEGEVLLFNATGLNRGHAYINGWVLAVPLRVLE
jgi:hypothetical protein